MNNYYTTDGNQVFQINLESQQSQDDNLKARGYMRPKTKKLHHKSNKNMPFKIFPQYFYLNNLQLFLLGFPLGFHYYNYQRSSVKTALEDAKGTCHKSIKRKKSISY